MTKLLNSIHKISIDGRHNDIIVFRNNGKARIYKLSQSRIARLSRHQNYYVSASGELGFCFSAHIVRHLTQRAADVGRAARIKNNVGRAPRG
jgi:ribosome biogenesis protein Nip4